jgi:hypothetical protein
MIRNRRQGFVLLMVLVLLAVMAAVLAGLCRQSLQNALAAASDAADLQRRWGVLSCQATLLPHAELLLAQAEAAQRQPVRSVDLDFQLGGEDFAVRVADEQAKLNLNFLYDSRGRTNAEAAARAAARQAGDRVAVNFHPLDVAPRLVSFGQIFSGPGEGASPLDIRAAGTDVTCWGNGKLNWHRASAAAISGQCEPLGVGAANRLLALQSVNPPPGIADLLGDPQIAQGQQSNLLVQLLAEQSTCHSIWIVSHAQSGPVSYDLAVLDQSGTGPARTMRFSW